MRFVLTHGALPPAPYKHLRLGLAPSQSVAPRHSSHNNYRAFANSSAASSILHASHNNRQRHCSEFHGKLYSTKPEYRNHRTGGDQARLDFYYAPLSIFPLSMVLRTLGTSAVSSSPLLPLSLRIMAMIAYSKTPLLNPDHNPLLRYLLNRSLYAQFCAGENAAEVSAKVANIKSIGFTGVVLAYAKEFPTDTPANSPGRGKPIEETQSIVDNEITPWEESTLETVRLTEPGDFAAFKFTGAGRLALYQLSHGLPPSPRLGHSIDNICRLAIERGVRLLFDGEQDMLQDGINDWTILFASKYNTVPGRAFIFGTYQAYKISTPEVLSHHLAEAQRRGFTLGVKLVRGAYLRSDPRDRLYGSKADTDACYDNSAASLSTRQWNATLKGESEYPHVSLMLATHNLTSVRQAYGICNAGLAKSEVLFAQLQGMADKISCEIVGANQTTCDEGAAAAKTVALPVYKYMAWGTTGECMKYLLRRAQENRDAVERVRDDRDAMWAELLRRIRLRFSRRNAQYR